MTFAYADPPYPGCAHRYPEKQEVDHAELIASLVREYPDGWALSTRSGSLREILPLCPDTSRIAAWVKPWCSFKPNVNPAYAWEPVVFHGGRHRDRWEEKVRDWIAETVTMGRPVIGAKPDRFCFWLFELLGMQRGDTLVDLYPGSGAVTRAWDIYQRQQVLPLRTGAEDGG